MPLRASLELCLMKRVYKLTITEEVEETRTPSVSKGFLRRMLWPITRIAIAIAAYFHGGH
ncbi:hypothetical protein B5V03_01535 [Bradyrhizobium betae]|uniref:Uncharacterized protein n=1 Tax=Bradyrhizobium betae TaxID=244734 RepID=A0A4Q1VPH9_9BRAD|nr:hypothetical protein B5V03_01535 [Bradyrhizobium betae]